jgi:hypothetical protein
MQIMNSLAQDRLGLRKYGRLVGGIGIKRDGSGGAVTWATNHDHRGYAASCIGDLQRQKISACREYRTDFIAEQGGSQLRILPSGPRSLLDLPKNFQDNIFRRVITPDGGVNVNLDKPQTPRFNHGLLIANRAIYQE